MALEVRQIVTMNPMGETEKGKDSAVLDSDNAGFSAPGSDCAAPEASEDSRVEAYYCLPVAMILDEEGTSAFRTCGIEQVEDIRQWMESLEEMQGVRLDFGEGEELKLGGWTWKVVIEEEPRVFEYWYITGEVELYEEGDE